MKDIRSEELLDRILCAGKEEIAPILDTVMERFSELQPDWELLVLTVSGHEPESHIDALQQAISMLENSR